MGMDFLISIASFVFLVLAVIEGNRERKTRADSALSGEGAAAGAGAGDAQELFARVCAGLSPRKPSKKLKTELQRAGLRENSQVTAFLGIRTFLIAFLPLLAFLFAAALDWRLDDRMLLAMGTLVVGYVLTHCWLSQRAEQRKERLRLQLPEGVDLLLLGSKAGLDLRRCFEFVQEDMGGSAPELSEEFNILASDLKAGISQERALRRLSERTGLDEIHSFAVNLMHSLRFGTRIDRVFEEMSSSLRTQRRLNAEEMIEKKAPKLVFPTVLFLLPAVLIIVIGPALFSIFEMLDNL